MMSTCAGGERLLGATAQDDGGDGTEKDLEVE